MQCFLKRKYIKVELSTIKICELLRKLWSLRSCFLILPPGALAPQGIEGAVKRDVSKHWWILQWCASRSWVTAHENWATWQIQIYWYGVICCKDQTSYKYIDTMWFISNIRQITNIWIPYWHSVSCCKHQINNKYFHSLWLFQIFDKLQIYNCHIICYKYQTNHKGIDAMWSVRNGWIKRNFWTAWPFIPSICCNKIEMIKIMHIIIYM